MVSIPTIDLSELADRSSLTVHPDDPAVRHVSSAIDRACREVGFFTVIGHSLPTELVDQLELAARDFFSQPDTVKAAIAMPLAGRAWRGWFPLGGELTSGAPDRKEGLYFGSELTCSDPRVEAGTPLHGPNLFPSDPPELKGLVLRYLDEARNLAQLILSLMAIGLGLPPSWFAEHLTADPLCLLRVFRYPPAARDEHDGRWGVGEHTDYGLLTLLAQDEVGGLEVHSPGGWVAVPPVRGSLVCNLGDMLERLTGGAYVSTLHRVRSPRSSRDRISIPFFLDPGWDAVVERLPIVDRPRDSKARTLG